MFPILICEDNAVHLDQISTIIKHYLMMNENNYSISYTSQDPHKIIQYIKETKPRKGIYFIDVDLQSDMNGLELAREIRAKDIEGRIIFITSDQTAAKESFRFNVEALGFIEKTADLNLLREEICEIFRTALSRQVQVNEIKKEHFSFTYAGETYHFNLEDVILLETSDIPHKLKLYTVDGFFEFSGTIMSFEERYPKLIRINRYALINPAHISSFNSSTKEIILYNQFHHYVSYRRVKKVKDYLKDVSNGYASNS